MYFLLIDSSHIPGSIQPFGALIAIHEESWQVRQASQNCFEILGVSPTELFQESSFKNYLNLEQIEELDRHFQELSLFPDEAGPDVVLLEFKKDQEIISLQCACHKSQKNPGLIILEFEVNESKTYPLCTNSALDKQLFQSLHLENLVLNDRMESIMGILSMINKVNGYLSEKKTFKDLTTSVANIVQMLTGFERVMIYEVIWIYFI